MSKFLEALDVEIDKLGEELKVMAKEIIGVAVLKATLENGILYEEILKIAEKLEAVEKELVNAVLERAKERVSVVEEVIGEVDGVKVIVERDGRFYSIYLERDGKRQWVETYLGKWAYTRANTILNRLKTKKKLKLDTQVLGS